MTDTTVKMKTYFYSTRYGKLVVQTDGYTGEVLENTLDADAILNSETAKNLTWSHGIWSHVIEELFGEDEIVRLCPPARKSEWWRGELTDYGFKAIFLSGLTFSLDHQGGFFDAMNVE